MLKLASLNRERKKPLHLIQKRATSLRHLLVVIRLECQPSFVRATNVLSRVFCFHVIDEDFLMATCCRRIGNELYLTGLVETDELFNMSVKYES